MADGLSRIRVNKVLAHFTGRACGVGRALSPKTILWGLLARARRIYAGAYAQQDHIVVEATAHLKELERLMYVYVAVKVAMNKWRERSAAFTPLQLTKRKRARYFLSRTAMDVEAG